MANGRAGGAAATVGDDVKAGRWGEARGGNDADRGERRRNGEHHNGVRHPGDTGVGTAGTVVTVNMRGGGKGRRWVQQHGQPRGERGKGREGQKWARGRGGEERPRQANV